MGKISFGHYLWNHHKTTKGNHQPLVDQSTFAQVQQVLREHDNYKQRTQRHKYLLQGLLYSDEASSLCFVDTHPKKKISYYRTKGKVNGSQIFYNTRDINVQLLDVTKTITIDNEVSDQVREELNRWFETEYNGDGELNKARQRLSKLDRVEKNLQRLVIEEEISLEDFKEHRCRIESGRANLKDLVECISSRQGLVKGDFEIALQLANELDFLYANGDNNERRLLCEVIFKRIHVRNGKIDQLELNPPFQLIASRAKGSESFLSEQPAAEFPDSSMVERAAVNR